MENNPIKIGDVVKENKIKTSNPFCEKCGFIHPPVPGGCSSTKNIDSKKIEGSNDEIEQFLDKLRKFLITNKNYKTAIININKIINILKSEN